ncbi:MAG: GIY-YIG nuclease family protein [Firmicutes bacterium]|nr:GIY-YIG nuclease family protein [Bacillota bacterium]
MVERKIKTYLIYDRKQGYYKIGKSIHPQQRLKQLEAQKNYFLDLVSYCEGDLEKKLHNYFSLKRKYGEWFKLNENNVSYIKKQFDLQIEKLKKKD